MTRSELEHAIRAACDVVDETELWVFGSQAILGQYPDAPEALRRSREVDVAPKNYPERVDRIDGALGELSLFDITHGFYVHGLPIDAATLPAGWKKRTVTVQSPSTRMNTGYCLEAHDLAASKLAAFREKDREFVRTLLFERLIEGDLLADRLRSLSVSAETLARLMAWLSVTRSELES